jgi:drug/metabolite transporter (DMT)-like permease
MATTVERGLTAAEAPGSNARGIAAMVIAMACFVSSDTLIKIVGRDMPVGEIIFVRGLFSVLLILPLAMLTGALRNVRAAMTPTVALRAGSEVGATVFFFSGLVLMPFADAAAIGQFAPLAVTAGAALFLREPVGWRRWLATAVGLAGVLLIIRPGSGAFNPGAILLVFCVLCVATRDLVTRVMGSGIPILLLILVSSVATTLIGPFGLLYETWIRPTPLMIGSLILSAFGVSAGYYGSVVAMRSGEISVVAPFRYASMLFALMWGYVIFGEIPDPLTWLGIAIVVGAGVYMFHRESVRRREATVAPEAIPQVAPK